MARAEYWVYLPGLELPSQSEIMDLTLAANPYKQRGRNPIGASEGLLFSDIRMHIALVLRKKNPHVFRPDLLENDLEISAATLETLAESNSLVKLRFVSEDPLSDNRHLQFLPHVADAVAQLGGSHLVYDETQHVLFSRSEFKDWLGSELRVDGLRNHVRVRWTPLAQETGSVAESVGLCKIGLDEIRTLPVTHDLRALITTIVEEAIVKIWAERIISVELTVEAFGDQFHLTFSPVRGKRIQSVRVERITPL